MLEDRIVKTELHIRFSDGKLQDLVLPIENDDELSKVSNRYLRKLVREHDPVLHKKTHNRRLKFIYNGQPMNDSVNFQDSLKSFYRLIELDDDDDDDDGDDQGDQESRNTGSNSHHDEGGLANSRSKGKEKIPTEGDIQNKLKPHKIRTHKIYIHCLIGDKLTREELLKEDQLDSRPQTQSVPPAPIGLDRLLSAGFTQEEVAALRRQTQSLFGSVLRQRNANDLEDEFDDDSDYEEIEDTQGNRPPAQSEENDIRQLEERLLESNADDPQQLVTTNSRGLFGLGLAEQGNPDNRDLLIGTLVGSVFGVLSGFLWLGDYEVFNIRTRMAIVVGISINFLCGMITQWGQ